MRLAISLSIKRFVTRQADRLHYILFHSEGALTEFFLGVFSITWGFWVLSPFWDALTPDPFALLTLIMPEWMWGTTIAVIGCLKVYAVITEWLALKRIVFTASLFFWLCIAISFLGTLPFSVGTPVYLLIVSINALCVFRSGGIV